MCSAFLRCIISLILLLIWFSSWFFLHFWTQFNPSKSNPLRLKVPKSTVHVTQPGSRSCQPAKLSLHYLRRQKWLTGFFRLTWRYINTVHVIFSQSKRRKKAILNVKWRTHLIKFGIVRYCSITKNYWYTLHQLTHTPTKAIERFRNQMFGFVRFAKFFLWVRFCSIRFSSIEKMFEFMTHRA